MGLIFLVFAFVLFVMGASTWIPEPNRTRVVSAGLACMTAAYIFGEIATKWLK